MKKLLYSLLLACSMSSCMNLESEMYDVINPGIFPVNDVDADALVTSAAYSPFRSNWYSGIFSTASGVQIIGDMTTDLADCQWGGTVWGPLTDHAWTPDHSYVGRFYINHVRDISKMTLTMERVSQIEMAEDKKNIFLAELRCGRGWLAYLLYDWYGPIPVATLDELKNPLDDKIIPRPTKEEMVKFIETELLEAAKVLPANYDRNSQNYGRFTKGLAYTVLMKLYMHEKQWDKAEKIGRELTKSEYGYDLVQSSYKDIFTLENEKNAEIIWACQSDRSVNQQLWLAHALPSQYPTKNQSIQKWNGYRVPWEFYNTFEKEDNRLKVLVGDFTGSDGIRYNQSNKDKYNVLFLGAIPVKYGEDPIATGEESQVDWVIYRYADVITLLSEAIVRNGNAVTQEAVSLLNRVRIRAGLQAYSSSQFVSVDDFLDKLLLERGHEFWFEGVRRSDLIRHGKYIQYAKDRGSLTTKPEYVLFPIPQSVINEGKGIIIQNTGY